MPQEAVTGGLIEHPINTGSGILTEIWLQSQKPPAVLYCVVTKNHDSG